MKKKAGKSSGRTKGSKGLKDLPMKKGDDKLKGGRIPTHANAIIRSPSW